MNILPNIIPYTGNKTRHMETILHNIPEDVYTFFDLFGGSGSVSMNVVANELATNTFYNEIEPNIAYLLQRAIYDVTFTRKVKDIDEKYSRTKDGYLQLRKEFNEKIRTDVYYFPMLYVLISRSFNNQYRVNKHGQFNLPYGERSYLNIEQLENIRRVIKNASPLSIMNSSYESLIRLPNMSGKKSLYFFDPPYFNSVAGYNSFWKEKDEISLYSNIKKICENGDYFMLTNTPINRGKQNPHLMRFMKTDGLGLHHLDLNCNHNNSSYFKSTGDTQEILLANFPVTEYIEAQLTF